MQILLYFYIALAIATVVLIAGMYLAKNPKVESLCLYLLVIVSLIITFISVTSQPSNYILQRAIATLVGIVGLVGLVMYKKYPKKEALAKLLVSGSAIVGMIGLIFLR